MDNTSVSKLQYLSSSIIRTPAYSLNDLEEGISTNTPIGLINNHLYREAIFLASPVLSREIKQYLKGEVTDDKILRLHITILKYYIRMCTRCTPFGLFAGCSIGKVGRESNIVLSEEKFFKSRTRLDMNYLCALIQDVSNSENVKEQALYYPNTSLYLSGCNLRYTEHRFLKARRKYSLSQALHTDYLQEVMQKAENGATINQLASLLVEDEITLEEAKAYINELIDSQILVSELEPSVTGNELLQQFIEKLEKIIENKTITAGLKNIDKLLQNIDGLSIGRKISQYEEVKGQLKQFETKYNEKYLFQSDLYIKTEQAVISETIADNVSQAITVFNKITPNFENYLVKKFKENFYKKYGDEEISLSQALDVETGIGFGNIDGQRGDITPLLEGIFFARQQPTVHDVKIFPIQRMLNKKYDDFLEDNTCNEIRIKDEDLKDFPENWDDLPDTISTMVEVIRTEESSEGPLIALRHAGGSSSVNLLGRFCYLDKKLHDFAKQITTKEKELNPNKVLAEIVHLPESRLGNILMRPVLHEYEIPYLVTPSVEKDKVIPITDLMVSVVHGRYIKLRSKRLNREVLPRLSSAHNFSNNSLPIYHFLCALQTQGLRGGIGFNWGPILDSKPFLPRVRYENIIFSPAIWNIVPDDTKQIPKITDKYFYENALEFKKKRNIPDKALLVQGDNKLLIDFNHELSVQMLFSEVKKNPFRLEEFLFDGQYPLVKRNDEVFTNQVILSFYKDKKKIDA